MAHRLTVWRAAQLVGVPRAVLQQRVRAGELPLSDDGLVSTEALLKLYPQAELESGGLLERVGRIQDEAFGRRVRERLLPSQEVLAQRLFHQSRELADLRRHLQRYHALVIALRDEVRAQAAATPDAAWQSLQRHLSRGLAQALATEPVDALDAMDDMLKVMSAHVRLRPSGREFTVEGHDTLLQAGLRAGLKLNYGCSDGSCGMCKARVVAGEVVRVAHCEYPLSESERAQGYRLLCAHTAGSGELTLEALEAGGPQDIAPQQLVAQVVAVRELAPDTRLLHLLTPRSHRLRFLAGQWVTLGLARGGRDLHGSYPLANCPCDDRSLQVLLAREDDDDGLARELFAGRLRTGDEITVWGPQGGFVLAEGHRPLVFAACDLGLGPVKSLVEHALALDVAPSLSLFWLATRPDGHFMANQCRAWSEALDPFEYGLFTDADPCRGAARVAEAMRADVFGIDCDFYLAGPASFVQGLAQALHEAGIPAAQVFSEIV
ncbi:MAG: 2Fe-2S iron-sulfur cluster-binding protein [Pseudomonadota bacterium]